MCVCLFVYVYVVGMHVCLCVIQSNPISSENRILPNLIPLSYAAACAGRSGVHIYCVFVQELPQPQSPEVRSAT